MADSRKDKHDAKRGIAAQKLISQMVDKHVGMEEQRTEFLKDAVKARSEYLARRDGVTSSDVLAWLAGWSDEDESEGPRCRR